MWKFISGVVVGVGSLEFFTKTELGKSWIKKGLKKANEILNPGTKEE